LFFTIILDNFGGRNKLLVLDFDSESEPEKSVRTPCFNSLSDAGPSTSAGPSRVPCRFDDLSMIVEEEDNWGPEVLEDEGNSNNSSDSSQVVLDDLVTI